MMIRSLVLAGTTIAALQAVIAQQDSVEWFPGVWARVLPADFLEKTPRLHIPCSESDSTLAVESLWRLFPGSDLPSVREDTEGEAVSAWACPGCAQRRFPSGWGFEEDGTEDSIVFPYQTNFTTILQPLRFQGQNEAEFLLVSFNTAEDWLRNGRFTYGILGLALFERQGGECFLRAFAPALDASGRMMRALAPDTVWNPTSKQPLLVLNAFQEPGLSMLDYWPMYAQLRVYTLIGGKFERILLEDDTECMNWSDVPGSVWSSTLALDPNGGDFPDLTITRRGRFEWNVEWKNEGFEPFVLPGLEPYASAGRPFDFVMKTRFVFDGKTYQAAPDETIEVKY